MVIATTSTKLSPNLQVNDELGLDGACFANTTTSPDVVPEVVPRTPGPDVIPPERPSEQPFIKPGRRSPAPIPSEDPNRKLPTCGE